MLGLPATSVTEGTRSLIEAVRSLNSSMGIPESIRGLKIEEWAFREQLGTMARNALEDACTEGNPRKPSLEDLGTLLEQAW